MTGDKKNHWGNWLIQLDRENGHKTVKWLLFPT